MLDSVTVKDMRCWRFFRQPVVGLPSERDKDQQAHAKTAKSSGENKDRLQMLAYVCFLALGNLRREGTRGG